MKKTIMYLALLAMLLFALTFSYCNDDTETITLNVYNWGEYISDGSEDSFDVNTEFEKYYYETYGKKVTVNYTTYASNEDMYAKVKSGATSYDIVIPSDYMIERLINEKLLAPINFDNIPNYQYIDEKFKSDPEFHYYDPENKYSVPYTYGVVGVIYNETEVKSENIGSWNLLWDEEYKGKILQFNNPRDALGTAMYKNGISVNTKDFGEWDTALEELKLQKPLVQSYVMDEIFNKMKGDSAWIAPYYVGDFLSMYEENDKLAFFYPKEGTNIFVDAMCIPKSAKNKEVAEAYINFMLDKETAVANAEYIYYASPCTHVRNDEEYISYMTDIHPEAMELLYGDTVPLGETANFYEEQVKVSFYENLAPELLEYENELWEKLKIESSVGGSVYLICYVIIAVIVVGAIVLFIKNKKLQALYD
ncbi:MAG: spermidine/putrescine ABC transporter substrate-binding protein [Clostridia bacterium]|nr:spermidine/putrescine ABC transporter substrate-binding protein [Clostridia bacterium]